LWGCTTRAGAPPTVVITIPAAHTPLPSTTPVLPTLITTAASAIDPTSTRTAEPVQLPSLTPSATPNPTLTAAPSNINPLTGLPADPVALAQRPLNVKVSNAPACVRPQHGLAQADLVFEHYVEAWATRFTAVFHSQYPEVVGSVRSARMLDLELPAIFSANFLFSGASGGVQERIDDSDFADRSLYALDLCPILCRVPAESVPCGERAHTLFANAHAGQQWFAERDSDEGLLAFEGWTFSKQAPSSAGSAAEKVDIYYANAPVVWTYEAESGTYLRAQSGAPHVDASSGLTHRAANVVVLFANHVYSSIQESTHWYSLEIQFWGEGPLLLIHDGQVFEGEWRRWEREGLFEIFTESGEALPLRPGQTWFQMVGLASTVVYADGGLEIDPEELPLNTPPTSP